MTVLIALVPGMTWAQTFDELSRNVKSGDSVYVIDMQGRTTRGSLLTVSADSLALKTQTDQMTFSPAQVQQVYMGIRDSRVNGSLIGLGVGAAAGALAVWSESLEKCDPQSFFEAVFCNDRVNQEMMTIAALMFGGIGAWIGATIDGARESRRLVYGTPRVSMVPHVSRTSIGAFLVIRP
jgi:hypothetical protein